MVAEQAALTGAARSVPANAGAATPPALAVASALTCSDKIPKMLPPGVWTKQVAKYNAVTIHGRHRRFPETLLLGAETILARIYHEHYQTKQYTPVALGEILSRRSFTATGDINPLAKSPKKGAVLSVEDHQLVQEDEKQWSPRSVLSVMDGIQSVVWAFILLELGEECDLQEFGEWCVAKARSRPQKLENFKQWWDAASWRIAMKMRAGLTFGEASKEVMSDVDLFTEHMSKELVKEASSAKSTTRKRQSPTSLDDDHSRFHPRPRLWGNSGSNGKGRGKFDRDTKFWNNSSHSRWSSPWYDNRQATWQNSAKDQSDTRDHLGSR